MACFYPLTGYRTESGEVVFRDVGGTVKTLQIPCGQCVGCRVERARQWSVRLMHEAQFHEQKAFLTLTYDAEHLPYRSSLKYSDVQKFLKRLRRTGRTVRFFCVGEYGDDLGRPHYHLALFGCDFSEDRRRWRRSAGGFTVYRSDELERLWPFGLSEIGELTVQSAGYMARYCLKKVTGSGAKAHYTRVDPDTGEVYELVPEFARMSLKPGIGGNWFDKYGEYLYHHDAVVMDGKRQRVPRYYDRRAERVWPDRLEELKYERELKAKPFHLEQTVERLRARETVAKARMSFYKRELS